VDPGRIRLRGDPELRRRRLAVLFRLPLVIPPAFVLVLMSVAATILLVIAWVMGLIRGRVPAGTHRFLAMYLEINTQVTAWLYLLSGSYPLGSRRDHPVQVEVPPSQRQRRLLILLRALVALPALVLASVFGVVLSAVAVASWFVALLLGHTTAGLLELGTFCLRYHVETQGYLMLLSARYPRLAPPGAPQALVAPHVPQ
jgi:hypothetical protein